MKKHLNDSIDEYRVNLPGEPVIVTGRLSHKTSSR